MTNKRIELIKGDITTINTDAIVNAANRSLLGGGGVDGAIHKIAGRSLLEECKKLNGCETGEAKMTNGYNLPAKFVIHTVGPIWYGGEKKEIIALANCYKNSLKIAVENELKSIAFPNISTGVYRFPKELAAEVAINEVIAFLEDNQFPEKVYFVCFDDENYSIYKKKLVF
jgi:O-acetyl-ADP-ribose deacetylase (regulator of RNase III)